MAADGQLEQDRLESLRSYGASSPGRIDRLDALPQLASAIFGTLPVEINLVEQDSARMAREEYA